MSSINDFEVNVVDYPTRQLVGFYVRTTNSAASYDCSMLWEKFHSVTKKLPSWKRKRYYGLFLKTDQYASLDFWTLAEIAPGEIIPKGMKTYKLSGGKFVHCLVPAAANILMAYHAVYNTWVQTQNEYVIDMSDACFELYPPQWTPLDAFDLYVKLKTKEVGT